MLPIVPPVQLNLVVAVANPVCAPRARVDASSVPAERLTVPDTLVGPLLVPVKVFSATYTLVAETTAPGVAIVSVP